MILQLEKTTQITGIDIGNENSAFIEVFVGKNSWPDNRFKVSLRIIKYGVDFIKIEAIK